ncbi:AAA family ATPase [Salinivibrio sp. MA351]|jgi:sigma-54-specific transcriptional regulator|uniref:AAA family ATPase n=1 Tax=Salinivibrio costicola subsp. alcaliphilus TaxID=272773 RepID=A0ABX3KQY2_SALCS|nr:MULTISPECIES: sigma 54-interacting transcriptional regulator [Salinivibrio]NUY55894.1 sigma 54-interacting transcriptional regulator [Salinivibrio sp. EAGSL]OOE88281.1 AAA family ATPase [Salinivibrio sp. AR640]OOE91380.1 AAA family ATPase [Salinivibrio sp. AR647]OOE96308.1 AAA family ATPase [Salinivibrio sp. MA351]OOF34042.1 AAA family ATPase [Salinivibrio costicola subsp. alcaliphilus]
MHNWLAYVTDLARERRTTDLQSRFIQILVSELKLRKGMLLVPSCDGRQLVCHSSGESWSVTDFDTPFAHVLQNATTKHLVAEDIVYWQSNRAFSKAIGDLGLFEAVSIRPLIRHDRHVKLLLCLIGDDQTLSSLWNDASFLQVLDVFEHQWSLLNEMEGEESNRRALKASLTDIEKQTRQQERAASLSSTLIGDSTLMRRLREQIANAASSQLSVLVQGETGSGKELVARAVHDLSPRRHQPFIPINCAAIPEHLLESELFGYEKGAFSGANIDKEGLIAQANGGTLFLDEIGDMPMSLQAKLLRVLELGTFRPVGGSRERQSDFRLVSATHVHLLDNVKTGSFRQDLYYRLLQYPIHVPSLAQRKEDVRQLSYHFLDRFNHQHGTRVGELQPDALDMLLSYSFPGNVRELKHLIEYACAQTPDRESISIATFSGRISNGQPVSGSSNVQSMPIGYTNGASTADSVLNIDAASIADLKQALHDFEQRIITDRLSQFDGDKSKAADSLGIPRRTLTYKCRKLEIKAP